MGRRRTEWPSFGPCLCFKIPHRHNCRMDCMDGLPGGGGAVKWMTPFCPRDELRGQLTQLSCNWTWAMTASHRVAVSAPWLGPWFLTEGRDWNLRFRDRLITMADFFVSCFAFFLCKVILGATLESKLSKSVKPWVYLWSNPMICPPAGVTS